MSQSKDHFEYFERKEASIASRLLGIESDLDKTGKDPSLERIVLTRRLKQELKTIQWALRNLRVLKDTGLTSTQIREILYAVGTYETNGCGHTSYRLRETSSAELGVAQI